VYTTVKIYYVVGLRGFRFNELFIRSGWILKRRVPGYIFRSDLYRGLEFQLVGLRFLEKTLQDLRIVGLIKPMLLTGDFVFSCTYCCVAVFCIKKAANKGRKCSLQIGTTSMGKYFL